MKCRRCKKPLTAQDLREQKNVGKKHCQKCRDKLLDECNLPDNLE